MNLRRASSYPPDILRRQIQLTEKHHLPGLLAAALVGSMVQLDYSMRSSLIGSVCAGSVDSRSVQEYLDSKISELNFGTRRTLRFANNQKLIDCSLTMAEGWLAKGIQVHLTPTHPKLEYCANLFKIVFTFGPLDILDNPSAMLLNSRPERKVRPDSPWLKKTIKLAKDAIARKWTLVSGYGPVPYLVVSWLAKGSGLIVVCDGPLPFMGPADVQEKFQTEFSEIFDMENTLFLSGFSPGVLPKPKLRWMIRDEMAGAIAEIILPCSVRPKGNMARILESAQFRGKAVVDEDSNSSDSCRCSKDSLDPGLQRDYQRVSVIAPVIHSNKSSGNSAKFKAQWSGDPFVSEVQLRNLMDGMLIHYTRACAGPWPGQSWATYLSDLICNSPGAAHDAVDTLIRIVIERKIRATGTWTRGSAPVVSFTEAELGHFGLIQKWRRGLMRHTFEPYGIAFSKKALLDKGVKRVIYGSDADITMAPRDAKAFFQLSSSGCNDWTTEKEWRMLGDLEFKHMNPSDWFVITPDIQGAQKLADSVRISSLRMYVSNFRRKNSQQP
ncbi:MAG: hypothetical protein ACLQO6_09285 [Desulfomonilaceae bacterium]